MVFLFLPVFSVHAGKVYTVNNTTNVNQSYPAVDDYNNNNIVAWLNLDDENFIESITILNTATHEIKNKIEFDTKMKFDSDPYPTPRHKLKFSDNWLAFSCRKDGEIYNSIVVFDIGKEKPEIVYSVNNFNSNEFDLYGHSLVFKQYEGYYQDNVSINLIDLQNNNKLKKIIECEYCNYEDISLYKNNIVMTSFNWDKTEVLTYNIDNDELQTEFLIDDRQYLYSHRLKIEGENFLYVNEDGDGGKIYIYNKQSKSKKEIYNFPGDKELIGIDMRYGFVVFAVGDFFYPSEDNKRYWNLYLYDTKKDEMYSYKERDFIQFQPILSRDYITWVSAESNKNRIKYTSYNDFVNIFKIDDLVSINSSNELAKKLKGKIIILAEEEGQAFYVDPRLKGNYYEMFFLGKPSDSFSIMREQGVGVTNTNIEKIPVGLEDLSGGDDDNDGLSNIFEDAVGTDKNKVDTDGDGNNDYDEIRNGYNPDGEGQLSIDPQFTEGQKGKILLQVENNGEAWYVNPDDGKRYFLGRPADAFQIMRKLGLGISNNDFEKLK